MPIFNKIPIGIPLTRFPARSWNAACEILGRQMRASGVGVDTLQRPTECHAIWVKNNAENEEEEPISIHRGEILSIRNGLAIEPVDNLDQWQQAIVFDGSTPNGHGPFVIALDAIPAGEIGIAAVSGLARCKIAANEVDAYSNLGWADAKSGNHETLEASLGGLARIVYRSTRTEDEGLAIVELSQRPYCPLLWLKLNEDMDGIGGFEATMLTYPDGSPLVYGSDPQYTTTVWNLNLAGSPQPVLPEDTVIQAQYVYNGSDLSSYWHDHIGTSYLRFVSAYVCPEF